MKKIYLYIALVQALVAVSGSLYFSEVLKLVPCALCWYQRLCMYPLVIIIGTGLLIKDKRVIFYALPFSILGLFIAIYHNLLTWNVIPESITSCTGVSCALITAKWFGFLTIPLLSLTAFLIISVMLVLSSRTKN